MQRFARLFEALDQTTKTTAKVSALTDYFLEAPKPDRLWTIALLSHKRPKRSVNTTLLRTWASEVAGLPLWLFEESYHIVGDLAEAIALVLPKPQTSSTRSLSEWIGMLIKLTNDDEETKKKFIISAWAELDHRERFIFNKVITGGFRVGVSQKLVTRALSKATGINENMLTHRLMGNWTPMDTTYDALILQPLDNEDDSKPYPFYLAYALDLDFDQLGPVGQWQAEYKWDGIRGQLICRNSSLYLWSRGEDLMTARFPEFGPLATTLPHGTVIDGEILPFKDDNPMSFQHLQTRIGRKNVPKKIMNNTPVILMCYDLIEHDGKDIRQRPLQERRILLESLLEGHPENILRLSPVVPFSDWLALDGIRQNARQLHSEGLMLKRLHSEYKNGRKRGDWWKWKIDPLTIDAVLLYAQQGHGRRANLFTDYTFAVWHGDNLVPFAKAYSGLTDQEFLEITKYVRENTLERFGPVRAVVPNLVFELAFEGIQASTRHKSGVALRFPRMHRWRKDKHPKEANTLQDLKDILDSYG
ncbi:MAG: ATP-dependent DNA ligase [Saprospiraceae bacterium]|nr:ATP-dependent DNA ligase [Saprospiraceae bacterium]